MKDKIFTMKEKPIVVRDMAERKGDRWGASWIDKHWAFAAGSFPERSFVGKTFEDMLIVVDGDIFTQCVFNHCQIVFGASAPVVFDNCQFNNCDWSFAGAADLMLRYLSSLYHGLGASGEEIVRMVFEAVQQGRIGQEDLITPDVLGSR